VPVVCSAWGGFKDVVRHGETGYLMEAVLTRHGIRVDWGTGAQHVVHLLRDAELRARMGARAAAWARARFGMAAYGEALGRTVAEAMAEVGQASARTGRRPAADVTGAYEPSAFARRYEAHKRACGWYADAGSPGPYPRMFQGREYALYERLMHPYATRRARKVAPDAIAPDWVPYFGSAVSLDRAGRVVEDHDPVWPHRRRCSPAEWAVLQRVDGTATVENVTAAAAVDRTSAGQTSLAGVLWRLHVAGFILFRRAAEGDGLPAFGQRTAAQAVRSDR
jgi:hypothetical protein